MSSSKNVRGVSLLRSPLLNRGTAFTHAERDRLCIEALLPAGINSQDKQAERVYSTIAGFQDPLARYRELAALQDRNEYLFYRILLDHLTELMPIIYTPTVGEAAQRFSDVFQRGRGLWITPAHAGRMKQVMAAALESREVRLLVVTDNESILGLGDQGAGGMTISIGKLALYTACAGIAPETTLPVSLDFGTNNEDLLESPHYLGWPERRVQGEAYDALIEEFATSIHELYPGALVQWEDFRKDNALAILDRYRHRILSFNDDIQGTGAVALAGVFSALRIADKPLGEQRVLIYGAGAAGLGIARQIKAAMRLSGIAESDLERHVGVLDSRGLLVDDRKFSDGYKSELAWSSDWARECGLAADRDLATAVARFRPTVLIGTSGQAKSFTETMIRTMAAATARPIVMPLSNPTAYAEATPAQILSWSDGRALIATGSPFAPVSHEGRTIEVGQGNNVFIFPALGMGALLAGAREVTDNMITATAKSLAAAMLPEELDRGLLYPSVDRLREVSAELICAVIEQAKADGVADSALASDEHLPEHVHGAMWTPVYPPLESLPSAD